MLIKNYIFFAIVMMVGVVIGMNFNREAYQNAFESVLATHKAHCTERVKTIAVLAYLKGKEDGCITH